jgi:hypothetical protein
MSNSESSNLSWNLLYKIGGAAILIAVIFFRRNYGAELMVFNGFGIFSVPETDPVTALEWFSLLQENPYIGLSLLGLYDLVNYLLVGLMFLALYIALRQINKSAALIAVVFGLIGSGIYIALNQSFSLLALSQRYAEAATEAQRSMFLAAGEALLAFDNPGVIYRGTGFYFSLFLVLTAGLIFSIIMFRSNEFGKPTAVAGMLANGINLCYFIILVLAPEVLWIPHTFAAPFRVIWYVLIARKLFFLGKG